MVASSNIGRNIISPLYNTLKKLIKVKSSVVDGLSIKHSDNRECFYIKFNTCESSSAFVDQEYQFIDCHLRLDKRYKDNNVAGYPNPLSIAHLTEVHRRGDETITVHMFFTKYAFLQSIDIKHESNGILKSVPINEYQKSLLLKNLKKASDLLILIKNENLKIYDEIDRELKSLDSDLRAIVVSLNKSSQHRFLEIGEKFIAKGILLNEHCDYLDKRHVQVMKMCQHIKSLIDPNIDKEEEVAQTGDLKVETSKPIAIKTNLEHPVYNKLMKLREQYDAIPSNKKLSRCQLIDKITLIEDIELNLIYMSSDYHKLPANKKTKISKLRDKIKQNIDMVEIFDEILWDSDLESLQRLFPYFFRSDYFTKSFFNFMFKFATTIRVRSVEFDAKTKRMFEFLYQNAPTYSILLKNYAFRSKS